LKEIDEFFESINCEFKNKFQIDSQKIKILQVYERGEAFITKCKYQQNENAQIMRVAAKSLKHYSLNHLNLTFEPYSFSSFKQELQIFKIIKSLEDDQSSRPSQYLAEFIGYMHGKDQNHPFHGSILLIYYEQGTLQEFCRGISSQDNWPQGLTDEEKMLKTEKEIPQLLLLAEEIVHGKHGFFLNEIPECPVFSTRYRP
jgi:hypothetical protein